jgi:tetratricopeptide (TPR) repeat protein
MMMRYGPFSDFRQGREEMLHRRKAEPRKHTGASVEKKIFLGILLCGFAAASMEIFADNGIARVHFAEAEKLGQSGAKEEALRLLDLALLFRPAYSDALLLRSRLLAANRENRRKALEAARSAVDAATWEFYSPGEGVLHLCGLLADIRSYREALSFLDALDSADHFPLEEYRLRLRCFRGLDDRKSLEAALTAALGMFPGDPFFLELFFKTSDPLRPETVRRFELVKLTPEKYLPAIAAYIQAAGNSDSALHLAWDYFRAGGDDPAVSCLIIEKALVDPRREMERFVSLGGLGRMPLLRKLAAALRTQYPELLPGALSAFSGTVVLDTDGDGLREEEFLVKAGKPVQWKIDENQDGLDEVIVDFSETEFSPSKVTYQTGDADMICLYADYPYVSEALYYEGPYPRSGAAKLTRRSRILPGVLSLPVVSGGMSLAAGQPAWLDYRLNRDFAVLPQEAVERSAYMYEERNSREPDYTQLVLLHEGRIRQIDIVRGAGEEKLVLHRVMFQDGKLAYGLRDLDRDGTFDVREFYDGEGRLSYALADTTGDGRPDYAESFLPHILGWDTDGDGAIDAREVREAGGISFREYYGGGE